ncbi:MAG: redoxin domain-containing protein, partial [Bryobacteraceae bacterium]|nr:redoxin domain-containing protein [Bryobacteraceae bacterium]
MKTLTIFGLAALTAGLLIAGPYNVGSKVENFTIQDLNGQGVNFSDLKGDVTVVMFIATQCPISNDYNQ